MSTNIAEQAHVPSTPPPTAQETFVLHQRRSRLSDGHDCFEIVVCPYLATRLTFEPWVEFDEHVQRTGCVLKEALTDDKSQLDTMQSALGRLWTRVEKGSLGSRFCTESLFPAVFDVVRAAAGIIREEGPPLICDARVILPQGKMPKPQGLFANNCVMTDAEEWERRIPCLGVTCSGPSNCLFDGEKRMESLRRRDAAEICARWNASMSNLPDAGDVKSADHQLWVLNAVTQALYSHSGCAVLWNYRSMVAMRIVCPMDAGKKGDERIRVQVSGIYTDVEGANATIGVTSALQVGVETALSREKSECLKYSEEIISKSSPYLVQTNVEFYSTGRSKWVMESRNAIYENETIPSEEYCWVSDRAATLFERECGESKENASFASKFFEHVLTNYSRILYANQGMSVLLYMTVGDVPLVVKYANTNMSVGSELLQNEVELYEFLRREHSYVIGSCLPDVLGIRMQPSCDPVLVLEYVGQCVTWNGHVAKVGGSPITDGDWEQIIDAATSGLHTLSKAGIWHGDESLDNIRAERIDPDPSEGEGEMRSEGRWRVWWVDLGLSSKQTGARKAVEKLDVQASSSERSLTIYSSKLAWDP